MKRSWLNFRVMGRALDGTMAESIPNCGASWPAKRSNSIESCCGLKLADVQTIQELQSLITTDAHGDAVIDLGHHDSVTLQGVTTQQLQQVVQAGHVLLH